MTYTPTVQQAFPEPIDAVANYIDNAQAIAWDGCHKIYLAMDAEQADWFQANYDHVIRRVVLSPLRELDNTNMMIAINNWWAESCMLRFVSAVTTNHADPNSGFYDIVPQGWEDPDDEDDWDLWFDEEE